MNHDGYTEIHGYANQYINWSFSTSPSQIINVWALDWGQYMAFTSGFLAVGHLLSTSSSDSGTFNVPVGNNWYIVFWNDELGSQHTVVTYNAVFVGDPPPIISNKSIIIIEPSSTTVIVPKTSHTILWGGNDTIDEVKIELYKGDELLKVIATETENDGSFSWIPHYYTRGDYMWNVIPEGSDYRIKIKEIARPYTSNFSNYFTITNVKSLIIIEPNSSSSYTGENILIKWETDTPWNTLIIKLISKKPDTSGMDTLLTIPSVPNVGYFNLSIPMGLPYGDIYRIVIRTPDDTIYEASGLFTLGNPEDDLSIPSYPVLHFIGIFFFITFISLHRRLKIFHINENSN
ncbi:hypothetical protein LCGC14_2076860 [marine sediment metagenome]|uniref:Yeast cell wall synthesis Kre9/Knh1-like N-terminal domain-containing protein n=1 Tax=marine sediment metagenome TaxID=412755 RepID=A0A0F9EH15_9ZZZZ